MRIDNTRYVIDLLIYGLLGVFKMNESKLLIIKIYPVPLRKLTLTTPYPATLAPISKPLITLSCGQKREESYRFLGSDSLSLSVPKVTSAKASRGLLVETPSPPRIVAATARL